MDEGSSRNEALYARIQQLEQERDELGKEIEQLCMQKAGPSYIAVATQMHFRRTAGLEQEIENLKNNLESCAKENSDLKKELSEAKRINRHLGQLHKQEATKNAEVVKQLELLNAVVATASGERDRAMMEAVQSKENEDMMSQKLNDAEKRAARLEQEVENLKKKFEYCSQENSDIKKDLSEATAVTKHLDQLHKLEVTKNTELVRQLELCNGVVATTSAERDHAMMEAMKAKDNEDQMYLKLNIAETRTASLEQEVENLKKKLESSTLENLDIKKDLSEAKTITHLDQLHELEVLKNTELVKQLELFNGLVATASAERDHAMMEAVKAKESKDLLSQRLDDAEKRMAGLDQEVQNLKKRLESCTQENSDIKKELSEAMTITKHLDQLHKVEVTKNTELVKQLELSQGIAATASAERDHAMVEAVKANENEDLISQKLNNAEKRLQELTLGSITTQEHLMSLHIKLAKQEQEMDIFRKAALLEQLETLRCSVDDHRDKLRMILSNKLITDGVSSLREYHAQQRMQIMDLLDDGKYYLQAVVVSIEEKLGDLSAGSRSPVVTEVTNSTPNVVQSDDSSKTVGQALQEKVSALLLLSQQEERHLLEVRTALRGTLDELQRNLKQATEEKVDALMELADVKQEYQLLLERTIQERQDSLTGSSERIKVAAGRDGKLKYLLKRKNSLKRWFSAKENLPPLVDPQVGQEGPVTSDGSNLSMDDARLQIENATLKDNIQGLKCLTSNVRKLRHSLMQAKETPVSEGTKDVTLRLLDGIFWEAELIKNALGSPFWPGEGNTASSGDVIAEKDHEDSEFDLVFAAGLEMVELLLFATQIIKEKMGK